MANGCVLEPAENGLGAREGFVQFRKLPFGNLSKVFGRAAVV